MVPEIDLEWAFVSSLEKEKEYLLRVLKPYVVEWTNKVHPKAAAGRLLQRKLNPLTKSTTVSAVETIVAHSTILQPDLNVVGRTQSLWVALMLGVNDDIKDYCLVGVADTEKEAEIFRQSFEEAAQSLSP
jgi:hypothetical protein